MIGSPGRVGADDEESRVAATGEGGPVPATGKSIHADYVYAMEFEGDEIRHMTKVWNAGWSSRELGWA